MRRWSLGAALLLLQGSAHADFDLKTGFQLRLDGEPITAPSGFPEHVRIASAGDVNADGAPDLIVGIPFFADAAQHRDVGAAYVIYGPFGNETIDLATLGPRGFRITGAPLTPFSAGDAVAGAGDVNGDGIDDVIVGVTYDLVAVEHVPRPEITDAGAAIVIYGQAIADLPDVDLRFPIGNRGFAIEGSDGADRVGESVAGGVDLNGDGLSDVIVGAPGFDRGGENAGAAFVVYGMRAVDPPDVNLEDPLGARGAQILGTEPGAFAALAVGSAGDFDGNGFPDIVVGASARPVGGLTDAGTAYVVYSVPASGTNDLPDRTLGGPHTVALTGAQAGALAGFSVAGAGDVNRDGIADVVIGEPFWNRGTDDHAGRASIVYGRPGERSGTISLDAASSGASGRQIRGSSRSNLGFSVAAARDWNRDGRDDVLVGAPSATPVVAGEARTGAGQAFIVLGHYGFSGGGDADDVDLGGAYSGVIRILGSDKFDNAGVDVAGAGDLDGDGFPELLVSAPRADNNGRPDSGSAYMVSSAGPLRLGSFSCRYSRIRVAVDLFGLPPMRYELPSDRNRALSCSRSSTRTLARSVGVPLLDGSGVELSVLEAATSQSPEIPEIEPAADGDSAATQSAVARAAVNLPGISLVATGIRSTTTATCVGGVPTFTGTTHIERLVLNGKDLGAVDSPKSVPLGIGTLHLGRITQGASGITAQPLVLEFGGKQSALTPLGLPVGGQIKFAETSTRVDGNPCAGPS